jgi:hypothetical protein
VRLIQRKGQGQFKKIKNSPQDVKLVDMVYLTIQQNHQNLNQMHA